MASRRWACLGYGEGEIKQGDRGDHRQHEEAGVEARRLNHGAGNHVAQGRAQARRRGERPLHEAEAPGAARQVGDHQHADDSEDAGPDSVQELNRDQVRGIGTQRVKHAAHGQDQEADQEDRLSSPGLGKPAGRQGDRDHHELGRDDGRRHRAGSVGVGPRGKLLPDQGQHRRVGEVEQDDRHGECHQATIGQELPDARDRASLALRASAFSGSTISPPRARVESMSLPRIKVVAIAPASAHAGRHDEDSSVADRVSHQSGQRRGGDVAGMVECLVASHPSRQPLMAHQPQAHRGQRRAEHRPGRADDRLR